MMPRLDYKFICDKCGDDQVRPNDENNVTFNSLEKVYCEDCYQDLFSLWEAWSKGYKIKVDFGVRQ